jgi:hypothetical protein
MKWNDWNLIIFGGVMGVVIGGVAVAAILADIPAKLFLGNDGRLQWETLVTGLSALAAAAWTVRKLSQQIRLTEKIENDHRRRRERAARALLPLALAEFVDYATACMTSFRGLARYLPLDGGFDRETAAEAASRWITPKLSENALIVLRECTELADDAPAEAIGGLLRQYQVQRARMENNIYRLRVNGQGHIITRLNVDQAIRDAAEIYGRTAILYPFARTGRLERSKVESQDIRTALVLALGFDDPEIERLTGLWRDELRFREDREAQGL